MTNAAAKMWCHMLDSGPFDADSRRAMCRALEAVTRLRRVMWGIRLCGGFGVPKPISEVAQNLCAPQKRTNEWA